MSINVLLIGASTEEARAMAAAAQGADVRVDVATHEEAALRLWDQGHPIHALVLGSVENASGVAETSRAHGGRVGVHILGTVESVADARRVLDVVRASAAARGDRQETLLSMIAHDIRAPLGVALGAAAEMAHPTVGALNEEQRALMRLVKRSLDRIATLSINLSHLARIETGRLVLARTRTDVGGLVREVAHRVVRDEELDPARIGVDAAALFADIDRDKFGVAVANVLTNAVNFARTRVEVKVARAPSSAVVVVTDDGPGLPAGAGDIFDRVRVEGRGGKTGSGFGLAVVRGIMRAHGGEASAETIAEGGAVRGARFTLRVPAVD